MVLQIQCGTGSVIRNEIIAHERDVHLQERRKKIRKLTLNAKYKHHITSEMPKYLYNDNKHQQMVARFRLRNEEFDR